MFIHKPRVLIRSQKISVSWGYFKKNSSLPSALSPTTTEPQSSSHAAAFNQFESANGTHSLSGPVQPFRSCLASPASLVQSSLSGPYLLFLYVFVKLFMWLLFFNTIGKDGTQRLLVVFQLLFMHWRAINYYPQLWFFLHYWRQKFL